MPNPPTRRRLRSLDSEGHGIDKLVFEVDPAEGFNAEAFVLVGPDGQPIGTTGNPLNIAGGGGGAGGPVDVSDRPTRQLGHLDVDNFPAVQPVSGTFYPGVQVVSGPLTDAELRATPVPVSGTFYPATQPISGSVGVNNFPSTQPVSGTVGVSNFPSTQPVSGPLTDAQLRAAAVPVSGTFWQATQPISGTLTAIQGTAGAAPWPVEDRRYNALHVSATGAAAAAVTATLPAVAGQFHYIESIEITMFSTAARTGSATPVTVTSTNLPGNPAWTFPSAGAVGAITTVNLQPAHPIRSAAVNTPTTIVCPGTASVIWRINVAYWTGS